MVRRYDPDRPVPAEVTNTALLNAIRAPSAGFSQGWDFVVLTRSEEREAYWSATTDPDDEPDSWLAGIKSAPTLILCLSDEGTYLRRYAEPDKGWACLLYTSDAADDLTRVDLGGRRIIKKKKNRLTNDKKR